VGVKKIERERKREREREREGGREREKERERERKRKVSATIFSPVSVPCGLTNTRLQGFLAHKKPLSPSTLM
jgi:hypothetical protein